MEMNQLVKVSCLYKGCPPPEAQIILLKIISGVGKNIIW